MRVSLRFWVALATVGWVLPAGAQHYDFSKPMTGTSQYVFDANGRPVRLGAVQGAPSAAAKAKEEMPVWGGAAPVQPAAAGGSAATSQRPRRERAGGTTVVVIGGGGGSQQATGQPQAAKEAEPQRKTRRGRR